jgi:hypothetical protein
VGTNAFDQGTGLDARAVVTRKGKLAVRDRHRRGFMDFLWLRPLCGDCRA